MHTISLDLETRSPCDLSKTGAYRYAEKVTILLCAYAVDGGSVHVVDLAHGERIPKEILNALNDPAVEKWAYNATFERVCLSHYLGMPVGQYLKAANGWRCSMVWAASMGLPLSLEAAGAALGLEKQKLKEGKELIRRFCVRGEACEGPDWDLFKRYNRRDVETEMAIQQSLKGYEQPPEFWEDYALDQDINDYGVLVDTVLARQAVELGARSGERLLSRMKELTGLSNPNSVIQLDGWLKTQGLELAELGKKTVAAAIKDQDLPAAVREVLELRQKSAKSSVKKYQAMLSCVCSDNRTRGMFQFYGASRTGRWAGRLVQLQNLPQNHIEDLAGARRMVKQGKLEELQEKFGNAPDVLSQLIRTAFIAKPDHKFIVADFSAIEARVIAWYAGEMWRQKVFREGGDIYCASASQMFKVPVVKHGINGHLRQKGKIAELALGYGGAVGALKAMGALEMGLKEEELAGLVEKWRKTNPHITDFWSDVDTCVRRAIDGHVCSFSGLKFCGESGWLFIFLPSGRRLAYFQPEIKNGVITYMGTDSARQWTRLESYGPKFVENIVQATARDLLCSAMHRIGGGITMHIHDEAVVETPRWDSVEAVSQIMGEPVSWAPGLLLTAAGYETDFYMKD